MEIPVGATSTAVGCMKASVGRITIPAGYMPMPADKCNSYVKGTEN